MYDVSAVKPINCRKMYRICIIFVLFTLSKSTFTVAGPIDILGPIEQCKEAQNISQELFGWIISNDLFPETNNPKVQCFIACFMEKTGILKSDGTVDTTGLISDMPNGDLEVEEVAEEYKKCAIQVGEGCEKKYNIAMCIRKVEALVVLLTSGYSRK